MAGSFDVRISIGARDFSLHQNVQADSEVHLASYSVPNGILALMKKDWAERSLSPLSSAEVKTEWRYAPLPL